MWLYYRFNLSQRDIEGLLAERGITVSREAIHLWHPKHSLRSWGRAQEATRVRERGVRKFKSVRQAQRFLGAHAAVSNLSLANAYFGGEYYTKADKLLSRHARSHPGGPHLWFLLADVQEKSGNILGMHQSRAEYFALNDAPERAIQQLGLALGVAKNQITVQRISTRIAYFESVEEALTTLR